MKFDFKQLQDVDLADQASWSQEFRIVLGVILFLLVLVAGYFFFIRDQVMALEQMENKEQQLKQEFKTKYRQAVHLSQYREQFAQMTEQYQKLVNMLPTAAEMPSLLDDVTFLATDANLQINSLNWQSEQPKDFYIELPIAMTLRGGYHQFGDFAAGVAELPRIISFHDFSMGLAKNSVEMKVLAKTYRFNEAFNPNAKSQGGK